MRSRLLLVISVLAVACGSEADPGGVKGSSRDVMTVPGVYAGYRVVRPCASSWVDVGVRGLGAPAAGYEEIWSVGTDILTALRSMPSVWAAGGYGAVCEPGVGTEVYLDDWRDVDGVIERVGGLLRDRGSGIQVGIVVSSVPVAQ